MAENAVDTTVVGNVAVIRRSIWPLSTATGPSPPATPTVCSRSTPPRGQIRVLDNTNLDRETTGSYTLDACRSTTALNTSATQTVTVNITDVNDNTPVIDPGQSLRRRRECGRRHRGRQRLGHPTLDLATVYGNWTITAGNADGVFEIDAASGQIRVLDNTNLDRETTGSYTLTLQVDDGAQHLRHADGHRQRQRRQRQHARSSTQARPSPSPRTPQTPP